MGFEPMSFLDNKCNVYTLYNTGGGKNIILVETIDVSVLHVRVALLNLQYSGSILPTYKQNVIRLAQTLCSVAHQV